MRERLVRNTVLGLGIGAGAFGTLGIYLNLATGSEAFEHPGPMALLVVIGGTIGGLVGPLVGAERRSRSDRDEE